jgi:hypothetical protein
VGGGDARSVTLKFPPAPPCFTDVITLEVGACARAAGAPVGTLGLGPGPGAAALWPAAGGTRLAATYPA